MAKKNENVGGFQHIEEQAFNAYREWPLWLMLRIAELNRQLVHPPKPTETREGDSA